MLPSKEIPIRYIRCRASVFREIGVNTATVGHHGFNVADLRCLFRPLFKITGRLRRCIFAASLRAPPPHDIGKIFRPTRNALDAGYAFDIYLICLL